MTTYVNARDALVAHLNTNWAIAYPGVPVYYENTLSVDLDKAGDSFLRVEIDFTDAVQADMGATPTTRHFGEVACTLFCREGTGSRTTLAHRDFLHALMKQRTVAGVTLETPHPGRKRAKDGWLAQELICPFWFHSAD